METVYLAIVLFVGLLAIVVLARSLSRKEFDLRVSDAAIALVAPVLVFAGSGFVEQFSAWGVEVKFGKAFVAAGSKAIADQVSELPVLKLEEEDKGTRAELQDMLNRKISVLSFTIGGDSYVSEVVDEYFKQLGQSGFFRFVLFKDDDGKLEFVCEAQPLIAVLNQYGAEFGANRFVEDLGSGFIRDWLAPARYCSSAELAVASKAKKGAVLARMEAEDRDWLPVVSEEGTFEGVIERSRLTSSLLVDVFRQLESGQAAAAPSQTG